MFGKTIAIILLTALGCVLISGCGKEDSTLHVSETTQVISTAPSSESNASTGTTGSDSKTTGEEISDRLYSGEVIKIESGYSYDLDWDGKSDEISFAVVEKDDVSEDEYYLQVNDQKLTEGFYMEEVNCYLANISYQNVILVEAYGVVDIWTDVYSYYEEKLQLLATIPYSSPSRDLTVDSDARGNVLHANTLSGFLLYRAEYILAYNNMLPENREYIMAEVPAGTHPIGVIYSSETSVPVYSYRYDNQVEWTIAKGDPVIIIASDAMEFMYVESIDRLHAGWIRIDNAKETVLVSDGTMQSIYDVFPEFGYGG